MKTLKLRIVAALFVSTGIPLPVIADTTFDQLVNEVDAVRSTQSAAKLHDVASITSNIQECHEEEATKQKKTSTYSQYIYNSIYKWNIELLNEGFCVKMLYPFQKTLTITEATYLLSASRFEFPVQSVSVNSQISLPKNLGEDKMPILNLSDVKKKDRPQ